MANNKPNRIFVYLLILTFIFAFLQVSALMTLSPLLQRVYEASYLPTLSPKWSQLGPLAIFVGIQMMLYIVLTIVIWGVTRLNAIFWQWSPQQTWYAALSIWLLTIVTILLLNQVNYPLSSMAMILSALWSEQWACYMLYPLLMILLGLIVGAWLGVWVRLRQYGRIAVVLWLIITILIIVTSFISYHWIGLTATKHPHRGNSNQPNVIMIGIDSLRPDFTHLGSGQPRNGQSLTPHLDNFLQDATIFTHAMTPLARTFPSWATVLTGQYPLHNGARFDLFPKSELHLQNALPRLLKQQGYATYFATDEKRFSIISHHFGVEHSLGPKTGLFDFLLGNMNDFPLSNLLINTALGHWLFPYTSINRSAFVTYKPSAFNTYVERQLVQARQNQPIFLAIHFCLPHWPYIWRTAHLKHIHEQFPRQLYAKSVKRVDQQAHQFIHFLKRHHFLDHSIVVVLSDHGESLLKRHDRVVAYHNYQPGSHSSPDIMHTLDNLFNFNGYHFNTSYGHGTDVLSSVQNHIVLAMKSMGLNQRFVAHKVSNPVSTTDIKPTIMHLLGLEQSSHVDGVSLVPYLQGDASMADQRALFMETGLVPSELRRNGQGLPQTLRQVLKDYQLHADNRLSLQPKAAYQLIPYKQRAIQKGQWLLAFYPLHLPHQATILVNLNNHRWSDDIHGTWAQKAPVNTLLNDIKHFYGDELIGKQPFLS